MSPEALLPNLPLLLILAAAAAALCIALGVYVGLTLGSALGKARSERDFAERLESGRLDAVKRSRAVLGGQFLEQLAPWLPGFPAEPTEVRFIGKPVDYIAFRGSSSGELEGISFIEVKSGSSKLSAVERSLREAVRSGRVDWVEYRIPETEASPQTKGRT